MNPAPPNPAPPNPDPAMAPTAETQGETQGETPATAARPITPRTPFWPRPTDSAAPVVLVAAVLGAAVAAIAVPLARPGLGWPVIGFVLAALSWAIARKTRTPDSPPDSGLSGVRSPLSTALWASTALSLLVLIAWRASEWLAPLCLMGAAVAGSLAVAGGRSVRGLVAGMVAVPALALPALPWAGRGVLRASEVGESADGAGARSSAPRIAVAALVGVGLLVVFAPLLAGADPAFGRMLDRLLPTADLRRMFVFALFGPGTLGAAYLLCAPARAERPAQRVRRLRRIEWALPVGLLVALFTAFVGVALSTMVSGLFGGSEHVLRTTGLTYAEYARGGLWQLLAVSLLTLPVIMVAGANATTTSRADRVWLRALLGALAVLTLVIVASAMSRMWAYQQAYGFTVLRVLVSWMELLLGLVYVLLISAGRRLAAPWLPRVVVGSGLAALLALGVMNPDRFISERNVERWQRTGKIDLSYLSQLSADVVPALQRLPEPMRTCALGPIAADLSARVSDHESADPGVPPDGWREWNAGRMSGRAALTGLGRAATDCGSRW